MFRTDLDPLLDPAHKAGREESPDSFGWANR